MTSHLEGRARQAPAPVEVSRLTEEAKRWLSDILDATYSDPSEQYERQAKCVAAIDRLASMASTPVGEVPAWQPIETALKTGRTLLLGFFNERGKWRTLRGEWFSREIIDQEWENAEDCEEGWYETPVEGEEEYLHRTHPTHWMPLPAAPGTSPAPAALADVIRERDGWMDRVGELESALQSTEESLATTLEEARSLLWHAQPRCCGNSVIGAEYMGSVELVCCGEPELDELSDAEIIKRLREMFPPQSFVITGVEVKIA